MSDAEQRAYLARTVAKVPLSEITAWAEPRDLDTIEWFASPTGICRTYAGLAKLGDKRVGEAMSAHGRRARAGPGDWPSVWFKGGSEAGVLDLSYLARTRRRPDLRRHGDGRRPGGTAR